MRARGLPVRMPSPLIGAWSVGLLAVLVAWGPLIAVPGELFQRDLIYPWFGEDAFLDFHPLLAPDGVAALGHLTLMPLYAPAIGVAQLFGLDGTAVIRLVLIQIAVVAYSGAFVAFVTLAGHERRGVALGALVAGVFAAVNPWAIARIEHVGLLAGYAFTPLAVAAVVAAERRRSWRMAAVAGVAMVGVAVSPHFLIYAAGIGFVGAVIGLLRAPGWYARRGLLQRIGVGLLAFGALEAYALAPLISAGWLSAGVPGELTAAASDLAVREPGAPTLDAITLTANPQWHAAMRPVGLAAVAWRGLALIPVAALAAAAVSGRWRRTAIPLVAIVVAVSAFVVWADSGQARTLLEGLVSAVPGGRGLREPDKLLGLSALAQAWGLGAAAAVAWTLTGRARWAGLAANAALAVLLAALIVPAAGRFLWTDGVTGWRPAPLPEGYASVLATVRADAAAERVAVFERGERVPDWDDTRVLRHVATRAVRPGSLIGDRVASVSKGLELARGLESDAMLDVLRAEGVDRVLVATDSETGRELAARLAAESGVTTLARSEWLTYARIASEAPIAQAASAWSTVSGARGVAAAPMGTAPLVLDGPLRARPDDLGGVDVIDASGPAAAPAPIDGARLAALAPAAEGGWEGVDGSPAGFIRWRRVLELQDLHVDAFGLGLGFAWAPPSTGTAARTLVTEIPVTGEASDVLLRALAGDGVAPLRVRAVQAGAEIGAIEIARGGPEGFDWVRLAQGVLPAGGPVSVEIEAGAGFAAVNAVALTPGGSAPAQVTTEPRPPPAIVATRRSRTEIDVRVDGARGPFVLVVNETFHPAWRATWSGGEARPVPVGLARMGFVIDGAGDFSVQVGFAPQPAQNAGLGVTAAAGAALVGLLVAVAVGRRRRAGTMAEVP